MQTSRRSRRVTWLVVTTALAVGLSSPPAIWGRSYTLTGLLRDPVPTAPHRPASSAGDQFGAAVAGIGANILVGAPGHHAGLNQLAIGAVYLFDGANGAMLQAFQDPRGPGETEFGAAVASIEGAVVVGSPAYSCPNVVYVFDAVSGAVLLTLQAPPPSDCSPRFGSTVAAGSGAILVADPISKASGEVAGAVYLFDATSGQLLQTFVEPTPGYGDAFGDSVAAVGSAVLVGAPIESGARPGAAYLFDATTGVLVRTFTAASPVPGDHFGSVVAALGDNLLVASPSQVVRFDAATGAVLQTFALPDGYAVVSLAALGSDFLVGTALSGAGSPPFRDVGAVFLFDGTTGVLRQTFFNPTPATLGTSPDGYGLSVAALGTNFVVGAPFDTTETIYAGTVYLYSGTACGDGHREPLEQCDDGNTIDGDGCSSTCTLEVCGPTPVAGCREPVQSGASQLSLVQKSNDRLDQLAWVWTQGAATTFSEFGDPTAGASYALCVYDGSASPQPLINAAAPAGQSWTAPGTKSYRYQDRTGTPSGLLAGVLTAGTSGKARITIKGKGENLAVPVLPLTLPVTVQIRNAASGQCWSATYGVAKRNTATKFLAKSD